jgi:DNA-binding NarL/FixJ family response regulator
MASATVKIAAGDLDGARLLLSRPTDSAVPALRSEVAARIALIHAAQGHPDALELVDNVDRTYHEAGATADLAVAIVALSTEQRRSAEVVGRLLARGDGDAVVHACRACPELASNAIAYGHGESLKTVFAASRDLDLARRIGIAIPREFRRSEGLSTREREVFDLMRQGQTNREIASALFISESTAKVHVRHILEKLGVHSRVEAVALATEID